MPETFFTLGLFAMAAIVVINFICAIRMYSYLRRIHHAEWVRLGEPSLFLNNSIRNNQRCLRFLLRREYLPIGDPALTALCDTRRVVVIAGFVVFGMLLVMTTVFSVAQK